MADEAREKCVMHALQALAILRTYLPEQEWALLNVVGKVVGQLAADLGHNVATITERAKADLAALREKEASRG